MNELNAAKNFINLLSQFATMASEPNPDPAQFKVVRQQLVSKGVTVGASYIEYDVTLQGAQAMMRNSPMDLGALCDKDPQCMDELASRGYGEP